MVSSPEANAAIAVGFFGLFFSGLGWLILFLTKRAKKKAEKSNLQHGFAERRNRMLAEIHARKSEAERYLENIESAFWAAEQAGALVVSIVPYADIESDMYRMRAHGPNSGTPLTRIEPVMTPELAEEIKRFEVREMYECGPEGLGSINMAARSIQWRVTEVPERFEPPDLKNHDRIDYPDLSISHGLNRTLMKAARKMLGYTLEDIQREVDLLVEKEGAIEVEEE
jgi:hypothetical protein